MKLKLSIICGLICLAGVQNAPAATLIEQYDADSTITIYIDGARMRTETSGEGAYGLMDLKKRKLLMVNPAEKTVMDMSSMAWPENPAKGGDDHEKVKAKLEKIGDGPTIAGYKTVHYVLKANGKKCNDIYASRKAFKDTGWAETWVENGRALREANFDTADACEIADYDAADPSEIGWPLKVVEADGQFTEIVRIEQDAKLPAGGFEVPENYKVVSLATMMRSMPMDDYGDGDDDEPVYSDEEDYDQDYEEGDSEEEGFGEEMQEEIEQEVKENVKDRVKGFMKKFRKKKG